MAGVIILALPSWVNGESGAKLFLIAAVLVGLLLLGRWISAQTESSANDPALMSSAASAPIQARAVPLARTDAPDPNAPVHPEMDFGPVILQKFYFSGFDAMSGPPDPLDFFDEVTVEVYFKQSDGVFQNTYTVATPRGLSHTLQTKQWDILYAPEVFIVNRYDLKLIREAVMERFLDHSEVQSMAPKMDSRQILL